MSHPFFPWRRRHVGASVLCAALGASLSLPPAVHAQPVGLPSMGAASSSELSPMLERRLGEAIMVQGRRDPTYIDDPDLRQYLTNMGRKLAAFAPGGGMPDVEIFGVRDQGINAFALPGGFIGVNSGLVVSSGSESELASVLAHELGHVAQRHIARGLTQQSQTGAIMMATLAASLLAALAGGGGDLAGGMAAFGQAAALNRQLGFSRDAEREADRAGFDMLRKAGYDPHGMVEMFNRLMNVSRLNEGAGGGDYASTHPLSIARMSDIQNRLRLLPPVNHVDSDDFWYVRARLRLQQASDAQGTRATVEQLRAETRTLSGVRQSAAWYGLALAAMRRGDLAEAREDYANATSGGRESPQLAALGVDLARAAKDTAGAVQQAQAAWKRWPERRALAYAVAESLQRAGRDADAAAFLRERVKQWSDEEPRLYELLAQSEERMGDKIAARRDMADFYVKTGALPSAVSQLQQARSLSTDFYEQSQLDVRIQEVKDRMADERELLERFRS